MITRDDIKREVDNLPDDRLVEVYHILQQWSDQRVPPRTWTHWYANLENFTPDLWNERIDVIQTRESMD